jgi:hypothetical protein
MKDAIKAAATNRATWLLLASLAGAFGEKYAHITNALGALVIAAF